MQGCQNASMPIPIPHLLYGMQMVSQCHRPKLLERATIQHSAGVFMLMITAGRKLPTARAVMLFDTSQEPMQVRMSEASACRGSVLPFATESQACRPSGACGYSEMQQVALPAGMPQWRKAVFPGRLRCPSTRLGVPGQCPGQANCHDRGALLLAARHEWRSSLPEHPGWWGPDGQTTAPVHASGCHCHPAVSMPARAQNAPLRSAP